MKKAFALLLMFALLLSLSVSALAAESDPAISTDINSDAAKAWKAYDSSASSMYMPVSNYAGYGELTEGQFFIAKFSADDIKTAGIELASEEYKLSFAAADAEKNSVELEGYVGMYWVFAPVPNDSMTIWTGLHVKAGQISSFNKFQVKTSETVDCLAMFDLSQDVYVGFAATSAIPAGTTVTISLTNNNTVSHSHTFEASSNGPEIDLTLTDVSIELDPNYASFLDAENEFLLHLEGYPKDPDGGKQLVLNAKLYPVGSTGSVLWNCDPEGIVELTPSEDGKSCTVKVKAEGKTTVTAKVGDFEDTKPVRVVKAEYDVTFDSKGGSAVEKQTITFNHTIGHPDVNAPDANHELDGWYRADGTEWDFERDVVIEDITLTARWKNTAAYQAYLDAQEAAQQTPVYYVPSTPSTPTDSIEIEDDETPLAALPEGFEEEITVTIGDDEVPLASVPLTYSDVASEGWEHDAVAYVSTLGIMNGTSADGSSFEPQADSTRGMVSVILMRLADGEATDAESFGDIADGTYYAEAASWASESGIYEGFSDGTFRGDNTITREQLVAVLYRYAEVMGYDVSARADLSAYGDAANVSGYAADAMAWAIQLGLVKGVGDGMLDPTGSATRAQLATILMRFNEMTK